MLIYSTWLSVINGVYWLQVSNKKLFMKLIILIGFIDPIRSRSGEIAMGIAVGIASFVHEGLQSPFDNLIGSDISFC